MLFIASGTLLYGQEVAAAVANGYVYFDILDSLQCHDLETTTVTCLKGADFDKLGNRIVRGAARRVWVLVPHGSIASPRECSYADFQALKTAFINSWGTNGITNISDTND